MKKTMKKCLTLLLALAMLLAMAVPAAAATPYDKTITFTGVAKGDIYISLCSIYCVMSSR